MTALPEPDRGRVPELDGVRGIAILLVLVWHYVPCLQITPPPLFQWLFLTWSGVNLFFVLSGFLIGGILLDHRDASNYFGVFYRRRACRILPIYAAWLLLYLIVRNLPLSIGTAREWLFAGGFPFWSYATFTQNFLQEKYAIWGPNWLAITWSLAVEEQFYLLLPLIIRFTPPRRLPYVIAPFIALAPITRALWATDAAFDYPAGHALLINHTDALLLGVLCAWLVRQPDGESRVARAAPLLRILLLSCGGFAVLSAYMPAAVRTRVIVESLLAVAYAALILLAVYVPGSPFGRLTRVAWLRGLGIIAYGTYLIHQAVIGLVFGFARHRWPYIAGGGDVPLVIASLAITIGIAAASWRWFEKPIVDLGRRWRYSIGMSTPRSRATSMARS